MNKPTREELMKFYLSEIMELFPFIQWKSNSSDLVCLIGSENIALSTEILNDEKNILIYIFQKGDMSSFRFDVLIDLEENTMETILLVGRDDLGDDFFTHLFEHGIGIKLDSDHNPNLKKLEQRLLGLYRQWIISKIIE